MNSRPWFQVKDGECLLIRLPLVILNKIPPLFWDIFLVLSIQCCIDQPRYNLTGTYRQRVYSLSLVTNTFDPPFFLIPDVQHSTSFGIHRTNRMSNGFVDCTWELEHCNTQVLFIPNIKGRVSVRLPSSVTLFRQALQTKPFFWLKYFATEAS